MKTSMYWEKSSNMSCNGDYRLVKVSKKLRHRVQNNAIYRFLCQRRLPCKLFYILYCKMLFMTKTAEYCMLDTQNLDYLSRCIDSNTGCTLQINEPILQRSNFQTSTYIYTNRSLLQPGKVEGQSIVVNLKAPQITENNLYHVWSRLYHMWQKMCAR